MLISNFFIYTFYENKFQSINELIIDYQEKNDRLLEEYQELIAEENSFYDEFQIPERIPILEVKSGEDGAYSNFSSSIFQSVEESCVAVSLVYFTNFGRDEQIVTLSVPCEKYDFYHKRPHPRCVSETNRIDDRAIAEYITSEDPIIANITIIVESKVQSREELANALLDLVQDKRHGLSLRCYPSTCTEYKYPIETLVEMGGDCDAHAFLFASLMKAAGFKVILLYFDEISEYQHHVAIAVQLEEPPTNSLDGIKDFCLTYEDEEYYFAETTCSNWRIGDLPPILNGVSYQIFPL
jgi:hypothetical protein